MNEEAKDYLSQATQAYASGQYAVSQELCDKVTRDEFGIDNNVFRIFGDVVNDGIANFLSAGIVSFLQGRYEGNDVIEDVPFFYPIIGTIRHNLLKNLSNDVISHYNG